MLGLLESNPLLVLALPEILELVLQHLDAEERYEVSLVCRLIHRTFTEVSNRFSVKNKTLVLDDMVSREH